MLVTASETGVNLGDAGTGDNLNSLSEFNGLLKGLKQMIDGARGSIVYIVDLKLLPVRFPIELL